MESSSFIKLTKRVNSIIANYKYRPKDRYGRPGGLLEIPKKFKAILIGDLHGCLDNLRCILSENIKDLSGNKSVLIILGDAFHNDQNGEMLEMETSLECLIYLFELIYRFPHNVFYIRGNHDTFSDHLRKSGIAQGQEFHQLLLSRYNAACVDEVERFFEVLPMAVIGKGYFITHAGPARRGTTRDELINIAYDQDKYMQLMWTRLNEFRGNPSLKEYDGQDVRATIEKLNLPSDTHFIVGHNPLWHTGETSGVWMNVLGIKNHHIIYCNGQTRAPYLIVDQGDLKLKFAIEPEAEVLYV